MSPRHCSLQCLPTPAWDEGIDALKRNDFARAAKELRPLAGVQWVVKAPKDFKAEKMTGEIKPGGTLTGRIVGQRAKTSWTLDFDMNLPAKDAAAGFGCK